MLYGVFFEEINHAGDGGLYAELIRNRAFEEQTTVGWSLETNGTAHARMSLDKELPLNQANRTSLRVQIDRAGPGGTVAVVNDGYWGIALDEGEQYTLSFFARAAGFSGDLEARLEGPDGKVFASQRISGVGAEWKGFAAAFRSSGTEHKARFALAASAPGTVWLDVVSLFPVKTWKGRPNGLRPTLAQMLADLKPAFLRFPGGCYVEGGDYLRYAFRWKTTVGDISERPGHLNDIWDYYSSDGLGFHEYLQMAEDLGAEPLYNVNVGMAHREAEPMERMSEWVQEALDGLEYANGPVTSKWGALRAKNGHPAPFNLKYVEIGNENAGPRYAERYPLLYKAIKERYPHMILIANAIVDTAPVEIVDHHFYATPERMRLLAATYDNWDRKSPKVFVGEYASNRGVGKGNLKGALSEAAYMIGFERNADVVAMSAYAPLFYHVEDRRWPVNLIGFDSAHVFGTPSYWVQWLFARNRGDIVLPVKLQADRTSVPLTLDRGGIGLESRNSQVEFRDVKVAQGNTILYASNFAKGVSEWRTNRGEWTVQDGTFRQTAAVVFSRASVGSPDWADYVLTLKARKTGGTGGVQVSFRVQEQASSLTLVLGGAAGTLAGLDREAIDGRTRFPGAASGTLETGRWYDVRIEVKGARVQAFLDGASVIDVANVYGEMTYPSMEAAVSRFENGGEIIIKVVNFSDKPQQARVRLDGMPNLAAEGTETVLTSANPEDENTIAEPRRVAPVTRPASGFGPQFTHTFAPNSLTILRLKPRGATRAPVSQASDHQKRQ
jgi:alpha-L-arabinofuranosidase